MDAKTVDIRRQMDEVRCSLGEEVEDLVESARTLADWHHYLRNYPWICLGGVAAVGFLLVPKRVEIISPSADALEELARRNKLVVNSSPKAHAKGGLGAAVFGLLANAGLRAATGYLGQHAGGWFSDTADRRGS